MAVKIGNNDITLKLGSADVSAAYIGDTLVYSGGTPPTYRYYVNITGLDNGDTCYIRWGVVTTLGQNGSNQYTTTADTINIRIIYDDEKYTVDYEYFTLTSNNPDKKVTFTYQGGGNLQYIPHGTDMTQYYYRTITRFKIGDSSLPSGYQMVDLNFQTGGSGTISTWDPPYFRFDNTYVSSLPCDVSGSDSLRQWNCFNSSWQSTTENPFTDLWIEFA